MTSAKELIVRPVSSQEASALVRRLHYSGKTTQNSQLHLGVFLNGRMEGAMQFGPPMDKRRTSALVRGSEWHNFAELNRMAFSERLPRNSESRALGVAFRIIRREVPHLKWVVSFSDATQCGDGAIYRASGFVLTSVKKNSTILVGPGGQVVADKSLNNKRDSRGRLGSVAAKEAGFKPLAGYQLRYVRFIDPTWRDRLSVPEIPFSEIPEAARMYRGARRPSAGPGVQPGNGGERPTTPLQNTPDA